MSQLDELISICKKNNCRYIPEESLKNHTTFRIGGKCAAAVYINSEQSAAELIGYCRANSVKFAVLGNGSNVLAQDTYYDGVVFIFGDDFSAINYIRDGEVECQSGLKLSSLCNSVMKEELTGLEFAFGIPGTVGGAVYMNAGAYNGEMSDVVVSADYLDTDGKVKTISRESMDFSYRHSAFMGSGRIILKVRMKLKKGNVAEIRRKMDELLEKRRDKQPLNYPSAGSTFKRPKDAYAAALIEQCGLKGLTVGGAQVSEKHSGFVINTGNATFSDVMELVSMIQDKVKTDTGYELEMEPEILK